MTGLPEGTLTYLLTDLQGSTKSWESEPDAMAQALAQHDEIVEREVRRHRGTQVEAGREGDSVLAVFTRAEQAALCARDLQRAFRSAAWPPRLEIRVRVALHTGEAHLRGGHYYGGALNRCARVLALCHPGQVLLTRATAELLADQPPERFRTLDLGLHQLRDLQRPEQVFQLSDPEHVQAFPPLRSGRARLTNLPVQLTSFVGREGELKELRLLAEQARLLTLTGPGGSGKTRLASELGERMLDRFRDGVWLVELAPLGDPAVVARAVATALDVPEQPGRAITDTLVGHCSDRELLIVLDNCEHLVAACAELVLRLLRGCPGIRLVATSREALGVPGEVTRAIPPLPRPEAIQLFTERAQLRSPEFDSEAGESELIADICRRLDGIPLALELAAARLPAMSLAEMARRLESDAAVLAGGQRTAAPRQRTLEGAIDWSYQLLPAHERELFRRLSVFAGTFSLEAFEEVCSGGLEDLAQLIAKSLVERHGDRYRCLETIRAFGRARLESAGELPAQRRRHAAFYLRLASGREPGRLAPWLSQMEQELDNLRAALAWSLTDSPATAADLSRHLLELWLGRGHVMEAQRYLVELLRALPADSPERCHTLLDASAIAYTAGEFDPALALAGEGAEAAGRAQDEVAVCRALRMRGVIEIARGDVREALRALEAALERSRACGSRQEEAQALHHLGVLASWRADRAASRRYFGECLELRSRLGRRDESAYTLTLMATVAIQEADLETARAALREALELELAQREQRAAWTLDALACLSVLEGENDRGLRLAGAASALFEKTGQKPPAGWRQRFTEPILERAREAVGSDAAEAALGEGRALSFDAALHFALGAPGPRAAAL